MSFIVAVLGAESTGKTTLTRDLTDALRLEGRSVALVGEYLREFCDARGRTPQVHEQAGIAAEQTRRITDAAATHDVVIADTSALMIAVYSEQVFGDRSVYAGTEDTQRGFNLTLLTALDLPWQADGLRDGPHVREPVDGLVRAALARFGVGFCVVGGTGAVRLESALAAVRHAMETPAAATDTAPNPRWQWHCERCGDAACELHLMKFS